MFRLLHGCFLMSFETLGVKYFTIVTNESLFIKKKKKESQFVSKHVCSCCVGHSPKNILPVTGLCGC